MSLALRLMVFRRGTYYTDGITDDISAIPDTSAYFFPRYPSNLIEDADYGVVKVQNRELVLDVDDFGADFGSF